MVIHIKEVLKKHPPASPATTCDVLHPRAPAREKG